MMMIMMMNDDNDSIMVITEKGENKHWFEYLHRYLGAIITFQE